MYLSNISSIFLLSYEIFQRITEKKLLCKLQKSHYFPSKVLQFLLTVIAFKTVICIFLMFINIFSIFSYVYRRKCYNLVGEMSKTCFTTSPMAFKIIIPLARLDFLVLFSLVALKKLSYSSPFFICCSILNDQLPDHFSLFLPLKVPFLRSTNFHDFFPSLVCRTGLLIYFRRKLFFSIFPNLFFSKVDFHFTVHL